METKFPTLRVRCRKDVMTSLGRMLQGAIVKLPVKEANILIAAKAVELAPVKTKVVSFDVEDNG